VTAADKWTSEVTTKNNANTVKVCGGKNNEEIRVIAYDFAHDAGDVEISFKDYLQGGADNQSWGFREFSLYAITCEEAHGC
jgi:hypothetical protein